MPQSFTSLLYHFVFSTKHREALIVPELQPRLYGYLGGIIHSEGGTLLTVGGMPDHIHMLVQLKQHHAIASVMRTLKANSSKWVHETFVEYPNFWWQTGYGAFTVGLRTKAAVQRYIETQAEHHKTVTFQDEYRSFLDQHGIEYEEQYLWD